MICSKYVPLIAIWFALAMPVHAATPGLDGNAVNSSSGLVSEVSVPQKIGTRTDAGIGSRTFGDAPAGGLPKCTGDNACTGINPALVAAGSCNGSYTCYLAGGPIAANSCNGFRACYLIHGAVGPNSCNDVLACGASVHLTVSVGANSCNGEYACNDNSGTIGDNSCNAVTGCGRAIGGAIGNYSCNGPSACYERDGAGSVGSGSCNINMSCWRGGNGVGNYSCNTTTAACQLGAVVPPGDCQLNDAQPAECIVDALFFDGFDPPPPAVLP